MSGAPTLAALLPALGRLDELLARALERSRELIAAAPGTDPFRGLYLSHDDVARSLTVEVGRPLDVAPADSPAPDGPLGALAAAFALDPFDVDLLVVALAPELDLRYGRIYAYLQDDVSRRRPSVDLALSLLSSSADEKRRRRIHLAASAPLVRYSLLEVVADGSPPPPLLGRPLVVDEQVVTAVLGGGLDRRCARFTTLEWAGVAFEEVPLADEAVASITAAVSRARRDGTPLRLGFHGRAAAGHAAAGAIASAAGAPLLAVDAHALLAEDDVGRALLRVFRERWLRGAVLLVEEADALDEAASRALARQLGVDGGIVVVASTEAWRPPASASAQPLGLTTYAFSTLPRERSARLWQRELAGRGIDADADLLADRFVLTPAQIAEAVAAAAAFAEAPSLDDLFAAARGQSAQQLGPLAAKISPSARWDELVAPDEVGAQLRELCDCVTSRRRVLDDWGFGARLTRGKGVAALFTGAAGTGKTLAAEIVAGELALDLYRIDLSGIVSKYIGETEKNLDRIFRAAEDANAVLFFDEADALFGKRSEVRDSHDRYANIEVSYLLQKMEAHEGLAILATNLRDNLDAAFVRRLAFIVTFPFPEEEERRRIWDVVWPAATPLADDVDLDAVAAEHRLSGGQIKNVALAAAYRAAAEDCDVGAAHLAHALRREYGKAGRELEAVA